MLPNFLVIGAQKCATSWVYQCLKEHPEVYVPFVKEQHFFDHNYHKGLDWYERYFMGYNNEKSIGEVSPSYLTSEEAAERIHETLGAAVKLIVCLRNPIDRAFSQYRMHLRKGITEKLFTQLWREHPQYIPAGKYNEHLSKYLKIFPKENIFIAIYEDIEKDPVDFMKRIFSFLDVDPNIIPSSAKKIIPPESLEYGDFYNFSKKIIYLFNKLHLGWLVRIVKRSRFQIFFDRVAIRDSQNKSKQEKSMLKELSIELDQNTRDELLSVFKNDIESLENVIDRDLSFWK
jgi:hypothetical protein